MELRSNFPMLSVVLVLWVTGCVAQAQMSKGSADKPTPQVRIVSPADRALVKGAELPVHIETKNFEFAYHKATTPGTETKLPAQYGMVPQEPNSGHVHVYLAPYPPGEGATTFFMVTSFEMPDTARFVLKGLRPGTYRLLVELVTHDHTPRIKEHPRDWPSIDMITVTIE